MANRMKGEASFVHDGADVSVVMNIAAMLQVERDTGRGIFDAIGDVSGSLTTLAAFLRAGVVQAGGAALTLEQAAEMVMTNPDALRAVQAALDGALPDPEEGTAPDPRQAAGTDGVGTIN